MVSMGALSCTSYLHKAVSPDAELSNTPGLSGVAAEGQGEFLRASEMVLAAHIQATVPRCQLHRAL